MACQTRFLPAAWKSAAVLSVSSINSRYSCSASCILPWLYSHKQTETQIHRQTCETDQTHKHTERLSSYQQPGNLKQSECVQHGLQVFMFNQLHSAVILSQTNRQTNKQIGRPAEQNRHTNIQKNFLLTSSREVWSSLNVSSIDSRYTCSANCTLLLYSHKQTNTLTDLQNRQTNRKTWFLPAAWKSAAVLSVSSMDSRYSCSASCTLPPLLLTQTHRQTCKTEQTHKHTEKLSSYQQPGSLKQSECVQHGLQVLMFNQLYSAVILSQTNRQTHWQTYKKQTDKHTERLSSYRQPGSLQQSWVCPAWTPGTHAQPAAPDHPCWRWPSSGCPQTSPAAPWTLTPGRCPWSLPSSAIKKEDKIYLFSPMGTELSSCCFFTAFCCAAGRRVLAL